MEALPSVEKILSHVPVAKHYFIYCTDPGAYYCLSPIYEGFVQHGMNVLWVRDGWCRRNIKDCYNFLDWNRYVAFVNNNDITDACVIIGHQKKAVETNEIIRFCKTRRFFSILFIDHWWVEEETFYESDHGNLCLPDIICVMDEPSKSRLQKSLSALCENSRCEERVHVVGHPGIELGAILVRQISQKEKDEYKKAIGVGNKKIFLFLMEPYTQDYHLKKDDRSLFGYTEYTILEYFFHHFPNDGSVVVIKPHPRQTIQEISDFLSDMSPNCNYILEDRKNLEFLLAVSDEVYGITTVGLMIAFQAGKPIKSLQVGRNERGAMLSNDLLERHLIV